MVTDIQSHRKSKGEETNNSTSNGKDDNCKGPMINSAVSTPDLSGLRRSARETSAQKNLIPSSQGPRKSERLEKHTATTPPVKRKSERLEKQEAPSSLRRSERRKKLPLSGTSGSKKSDKSPSSSDINGKKEKQRSVDLSTTEAQRIKNVKEPDTRHVILQEKRRDARSYKAQFKGQMKKAKGADHDRILNGTDSASLGSSKPDDVDCAKLVDSASHCSQTEAQNLDTDSIERASEKALRESSTTACKSPNESSEKELGISHFSGVCTDKDSAPKDVDGVEALCEAEMVQIDYSAPENLQALDFVGSSFDDRAINSATAKIMPSDVSAAAATKDIPVHSSTSVGKRKIQLETCHTCFKRQRIDQDDSVQLELCSCNTTANQNLPDTFALMDRGEPEPTVVLAVPEENNIHMQQEASSIDIPESCQNLCITCKMGGVLLYCGGRGCKRSYHLSCLDPPFDDVPPGVWHCPLCVAKVIESGVHSVSEGVESIWKTREIEVGLDDRGLQKEKQFFVKYKGLAHIHNCWIPEKELLAEAPSVVENFNQKSQGVCWKEEWTVPHQLLQKRLVPPKQSDEYLSGQPEDKVDCCNEWLVKWRGLDYEHATWELETAAILKCPEGQNLINEYKARHGKAKEVALNEADKAREIKGSSGLVNNLDFVNKLCQHWHKRQNVIVFDNQERIMKMISYISSSVHYVCRPFLIISTSDAIKSWEDEFLHLAPSLDVVIYKGSKETRIRIRTLEFYEEGGALMFRVLVALPEVIVEDLNVFESIEWGGIIIDECQCSSISSIFVNLKMLLLTTQMRILLVCGQLKESVCEYRNILSLLDPRGNDATNDYSNCTIANLKERLMKYTVYDYKSDASKFVEYWVPVELSNVQLEKYCATLLTNSLYLRSPPRNDHVGTLRDILFSIRKCCDHPYIGDPSLVEFITKECRPTEWLEVGIKASGKLQLLDTMLQEIKNQGLKVLILFQSIGSSGRDALGDILDDYLRQRFGEESYERVDGVLNPSKKQAALTKFNNESGRFVFLLETRACLPSIKLSSVGNVIIYDSDWYPMADIRSLQKITLDSKFEQIKVLRLYSSCTVEERALILAKRNTHDSQNISRSLESNSLSRVTSHMLLKWGASFLLNKLFAFHHQNNPASITGDQSLLKVVHQEFLKILSGNGQDNDANKSSKIVKVKQNHGAYTTDYPLVGEPKFPVIDEEQTSVFWTKLLEGRKPVWKYSSISSPRNRKRTLPEVETEEVGKKRRKGIGNIVNHPSVTPPHEGIVDSNKEGTMVPPACDVSQSFKDCVNAEQVSIPMLQTNGTSESFQVDMAASKDRRDLLDSQQSLHLYLKPEIAKLFHVLKLSEDVKNIAEKFLEYVMNNHLVDREPKTMLHAFQLSLCWTAASLLKQKVSRKESLARAKDHLNFGCKLEEAEYASLKLRCLKRLFLHSTGNLKVPCSPKSSNLFNKEEQLNAMCSQAASDLQNLNVDVESGPYDLKQFFSEMMAAPGFQYVKKDFLKSVKDIAKKYKKQETKLLHKYDEENEKLEKMYAEGMATLEDKKKFDVASIRLLSNISLRAQKLSILDNEYAKKLEGMKRERDEHAKSLEALQVSVNKVQQEEADWMEGMKSWAKRELANAPLNRSGYGVENSLNNKGVAMLDSETDVHVDDILVSELRPSKVHESTDEIVDMVVPPASLHVDNQSLDDAMVSEAALATRIGEDQNSCVLINVSSVKQIHVPDTIPQLDIHDGDGSAQHPKGATLATISHEVIHGCSVLRISDRDNEHLSDSGRQEPNLEDASIIHDREVPSSIPENGGSRDGPEHVLSSEENICDGTIVRVSDAEVPSVGLEENDASENPPASGEQVPPGAPLVVTDVAVSELAAANKDNSGPHDVALDNPVEDSPQVEVDRVLSEERNVEELSPADLISSQPITNLSQVGQGASTQEFPVVSSIPCTSTSVQPEVDVAAIEMHEGPGDADQNHEGPVTEPVVESHPTQLGDPQIGHILPEIISSPGTEILPIPEDDIANQVTETPVQLEENNNELSYLALLQQPLDTPVMGLSPQVRETRTLSSTSGYGNPAQFAAQMAALMPSGLSQDPLQNELERIQKETEIMSKSHEEAQSRVQSDCDKEIKDAIAQIRAKHNSRSRDIRAEYNVKKEEMDAIYKKVSVNKMLAEAFRSKCMYITQPPSFQGMQQDTGTIMAQAQQLLQRSGHQSLQRPFPAPRLQNTSVVPNTPLPAAAANVHPTTSLPAPNVPNTPVPAQNTRVPAPNTTLPLSPNVQKTPVPSPAVPNTSLPARSLPNAPVPASGPPNTSNVQNAPIPAPGLPNASLPIPSLQNRPVPAPRLQNTSLPPPTPQNTPGRIPNTPVPNLQSRPLSTPNLQQPASVPTIRPFLSSSPSASLAARPSHFSAATTNFEPRAMAPHLAGAFRPSMNNLPRGRPGPNLPVTSSPSLTQLQSQLPGLVYNSATCKRAEGARIPASVPNLTRPAMELHRAGTNPNLASSLAYVQDLIESERGRQQTNPSQTSNAAAADVVCLSDDD